MSDADALRMLEEQRVSLEECQARKPWNLNCDVDALSVAHFALINEDVAALKPLEAMTAWSFEDQLKIKQPYTECP